LSGYALLWSGGKDSSLALRRSLLAGLEVRRLLNFHDAATGRVRFHATRVELLRAQADALGTRHLAAQIRALGPPSRSSE